MIWKDCIEELNAFQKYGARQKKDSDGWEPDVPTFVRPTLEVCADCGVIATEKIGDAWLCKPCYTKMPKLPAAVCGLKDFKVTPNTAMADFKDIDAAVAGVQGFIAERMFNRAGISSINPTPSTRLTDYDGALAGPSPRKCPRCGTNPGRCEKSLDSTETSCFRCGSELEAL